MKTETELYINEMNHLMLKVDNIPATDMGKILPGFLLSWVGNIVAEDGAFAFGAGQYARLLYWMGAWDKVSAGPQREFVAKKISRVFLDALKNYV